MASSSPRDKAELDEAIETVVRSGVLGSTKTKTVCGSTLCSVEILDGAEGGANKAAEALITHSPKLFASSLVLPTETGGTRVYLGRKADDLTVGPEPVVEHSEIRHPDDAGPPTK
jgi:hypothetical protein